MPDLLLEVRPFDRMRPVSPNSFVSPVSVDRSHFFTVLISAAASLRTSQVRVGPHYNIYKSDKKGDLTCR